MHLHASARGRANAAPCHPNAPRSTPSGGAKGVHSPPGGARCALRAPGAARRPAAAAAATTRQRAAGAGSTRALRLVRPSRHRSCRREGARWCMPWRPGALAARQAASSGMTGADRWSFSQFIGVCLTLGPAPALHEPGKLVGSMMAPGKSGAACAGARSAIESTHILILFTPRRGRRCRLHRRPSPRPAPRLRRLPCARAQPDAAAAAR